jgi:hypothetical protein
MTTEKFTEPAPRRTIFAATLARLMRQPRIDGLRGLPLLQRFAGRKAMQKPDPVSLAVLAIDRVGPAAVRACASGVEVCVTAPDEATARVLRAALSQTAVRRGTDRLIRIVVD